MTQEGIDWSQILFADESSNESNDVFHFLNEPFHSIWWTFCIAVIGTFVVSTLTGNYSQTDKLWSIIPFIYAWQSSDTQRGVLMAVLATIWGVRLTANFARIGGYDLWRPWLGHEDYRWKIIQKGKFWSYIHDENYSLNWHLFNLLFISFYQQFILLLITSPSFVVHALASQNGSVQELNWLDGVATLLICTFIVLETIADNQQYAFQTEKKRRLAAQSNDALTGDYADGFCQSGLFGIVRKPNYAAEQSIWISYYLFSVAASPEKAFWNVSIAGPILLVLLFAMSAAFTENISQSKYPKYATEYKKRVPLFIPNIFRLLNNKEPATKDVKAKQG